MADLIMNVGLGRFVYYSTLPAASDALVVIPLEATGLEADATIVDHATVADLLAGTSNEQTTMGRKTVTSVTVTVDDTNDLVDVDIPDQTWTAASGAGVGALIIAYDPATGSGTDADLIPLTKHDFTVTPDGSDITAVIATGGFARAT